jgi:hypothetical protein
MKEKIIKVKTVNKMLLIKGKLSRTPLEAIIKSETELKLLKASMIHQCIDFVVEDYIKPEPIKKSIEKPIATKKKIEKKKIENPTTILEKLSIETDE